MSDEFDLSWILPYVRDSLRGRGNFSFDGFADAVFAVLERVGVGKGIEKRPLTQGYTGYTYNFDAVHPDIRLAVTEAFYYLEQNRFILALRQRMRPRSYPSPNVRSLSEAKSGRMALSHCPRTTTVT